MSNYPDNMPSAKYVTYTERCSECDTEMYVDYLIDMGSYWPESDTTCPECGEDVCEN